MPYIQDGREELLMKSLVESCVDVAGRLNFAFIALCVRYVQIHGLNYQTLNDITGAFDNAKMEWYRRVAIPYEDLKIEQNGDVIPAEILDKLKK